MLTVSSLTEEHVQQVLAFPWGQGYSTFLPRRSVFSQELSRGRDRDSILIGGLPLSHHPGLTPGDVGWEDSLWVWAAYVISASCFFFVTRTSCIYFALTLYISLFAFSLSSSQIPKYHEYQHTHLIPHYFPSAQHWAWQYLLEEGRE